MLQSNPWINTDLDWLQGPLQTFCALEKKLIQRKQKDWKKVFFYLSHSNSDNKIPKKTLVRIF